MEGTVITKKGILLLAKLLATKGALHLTRAAVGTGKLLNGYDPASMIEMIDYKMDAKISKCEADGDTAEVTMQISSTGVETGFMITEVGIFAEDPDDREVLYAYIDLSDDPQYIYPEGGESIKFVEITMEIAISDGTKVTAYINPSGLVTKEEAAEQSKVIKYEISKRKEELENHLADHNNPHQTDKVQIGLGEVDNTSDKDKPVSTAQRDAIDAVYQQATGYTDTKIGQLINGAPETLDTLGEIAQAMQENDNVVDALNQAIGSKASEADFTGHAGNNTVHITASERQGWNGHVGDNTVHITATERQGWNGHVGDNTVHITATERQTWNGKADANHSHGYLPLSGGAMAGPIDMQGNELRIRGLAKITSAGGHDMRFTVNDGTNALQLLLQGLGDVRQFFPSVDGGCNLGISVCRWKDIYAANAVISTSDERLKDNIRTLDNDLIKAFVMGLTPISYTRIDGDSGRTHYGFGAQSIEQLMQELGMTSLDFAGFIKSPTMEAYEEIGEDGEGRIKYREIPGEYIYGLRYEEFIAPLTKVVQMQEEMISKQSKMIQELSSRLETLERCMDTVGNHHV